VRESAEKLRYRDFLIVSLIVNRADLVADNWIYVHEPGVKVGRIQNFKNWSPAMVPDPTKTCLGMEYFVFENDEVWSSADADLVAMAKRELVQLGLAKADEIEDGTVVRMPKAYPMYDTGWSEHVNRIRRYLDEDMPNLQLVGRNGMHKYNNQDHSMMTALCAARNILGEQHDIWAINTEPDYHEEKVENGSTAGELRRPAYAEPPRVRPVTPATEGATKAA
jgi:protoporphyrinogen oxidase